MNRYDNKKIKHIDHILTQKYPVYNWNNKSMDVVPYLSKSL